jgi:PAS domain S-box-containing protein
MFLWLGTFLFLQCPVAAQVNQVRRVLILDDLGTISSPDFAEVGQAVFLGLQKSSYQIELYQESLQVTLFPDNISQRRFREEFVRKYSDRKPDVIITVGPTSLKFIVELHERFVQDTPIVFCAVLGEIPELVNSDKHFTGVWGRLHPEETLIAALHMLPGTKRVVVVGGVGKLDDRLERVAKEAFQNYESKLEFTYFTNLTMPDLLERLKHLPSHTIVYHTAITQDAAGARFIDSAQSVPLVAGAAQVPVFVMDDLDLRAGTVGGDLVNWADDGRVAAEMAMRVLNGEKPEYMPIVTSNHNYMFDWYALQRWGLNESNLPPDSIVLNKPPSFWELYKWYIISSICLVLFETLLIGALLWQRAERRKAEKQQAIAFEAAKESEQRFRLVADTAPVMIWLSGADKLCTYVNQTWLEFTGRSVEEELGNGWVDGVHSEDARRCLQTYAQAFDQRESFQMEYRLRRHDGEYRWIFDYGVPRVGGDSPFVGYIGCCLDITERKQAEEALSFVNRRLLEAHEEERARIARELHDDINQRMALLAINLEGLKENRASTGGQASSIEHLQKQVQEIGSDIQALSHQLHSSKLELLGLEAASAGFCRELSELRNVEIDFHSESVPKDLPKEVSLCLFRVLQEALQNAVKHSGSRHFQVSLCDGTNEVALTVHDSGAGFDPEETINRHGLGLTSMKERLKLVDGKLFIDSKLEQGTTIHARVPLKPKSSAAATG